LAAAAGGGQHRRATQGPDRIGGRELHGWPRQRR
jgi:hypothetical protein